MWFIELFSTSGRYGRGRYILTDIATQVLAIVFIFLVSFASKWFLIVAVPGWPALWWINIAATVKRLHDLGRPGDDILKLFIPFIGSWMDLKLMYQPGIEEGTGEAMRDYNIREYNRRHPGYQPPDYRNFIR